MTLHLNLVHYAACFNLQTAILRYTPIFICNSNKFIDNFFDKLSISFQPLNRINAAKRFYSDVSDKFRINVIRLCRTEARLGANSTFRYLIKWFSALWSCVSMINFVCGKSTYLSFVMLKFKYYWDERWKMKNNV